MRSGIISVQASQAFGSHSSGGGREQRVNGKRLQLRLIDRAVTGKSCGKGPESSIRTIDNDDQKKVISRQIYSVAGMPRKNLAKGVNICNEQLEDGHTRTKKVIVK